jgi:hypothetical protein
MTMRSLVADQQRAGWERRVGNHARSSRPQRLLAQYPAQSRTPPRRGLPAHGEDLDLTGRDALQHPLNER